MKSPMKAAVLTARLTNHLPQRTLIMKRTCKYLFVSLFAMSTTSTYATGIPVVDALHSAISAGGWLEQVASWAKQVADMKLQYDQMIKEYKAMTDIRGLANLYFDQLSYQYLPENINDIMDVNGANGMIDSIQSISQSMKILDISNSGFDQFSATSVRFKNTQNQNAIFRLLNEKGYEQMQKRINRIAQLTQAIDSQTDIKGIADLQARIQGEQTLMQNEQAKLQILAQLQSSQNAIAAQQTREILIRDSIGPMPDGY